MSRVDFSGNKFDFNIALAMAKERYKPFLKRIKKNYGINDEFLSVVGEMAFAIFANLPMSIEHIVGGGDGGIDFIWHGFTIDIKSSQTLDSGLKYNFKNNHHSDVYVLAITPRNAPDQTRLIGWAWGYEFNTKGVSTSWNNGLPPALVIAQDDLHPMDELESILIMERENEL